MKIIRKPEWLQKKISTSSHGEMERLLGDLSLHTVCQEAFCPNISECFRQHQATFLILGKICTRLCSFCNVGKGVPRLPDEEEPVRVAEAVRRLGLAHVVVTSPTRDDLADGGASQYAATVQAIREAAPGAVVELLVPDFRGDRSVLEMVLDTGPDIVGHNIETVPRLYHIREGADYLRSLKVLEYIQGYSSDLKTKSGVMLGLGETEEELLVVLADLRRVNCCYLSIGQYLAPSRRHHPVAEFIEPERFDRYRAMALEMGFMHVESGPYVRSSYHAADYRGRFQ